MAKKEKLRLYLTRERTKSDVPSPMLEKISLTARTRNTRKHEKRRPYVCATRQYYSTIDRLHTINPGIEKCAEYKRPLYMAFIDYKNAFDSFETSTVLEAFGNQGVKEAYVEVLQNIYRGCTATMVLHRESNKITMKKEVRQGDTFSPVPFNWCLEEVFRTLDGELCWG